MTLYCPEVNPACHNIPYTAALAGTRRQGHTYTLHTHGATQDSCFVPKLLIYHAEWPKLDLMGKLSIYYYRSLIWYDNVQVRM